MTKLLTKAELEAIRRQNIPGDRILLGHIEALEAQRAELLTVAKEASEAVVEHHSSAIAKGRAGEKCPICCTETFVRWDAAIRAADGGGNG